MSPGGIDRFPDVFTDRHSQALIALAVVVGTDVEVTVVFVVEPSFDHNRVPFRTGLFLRSSPGFEFGHQGRQAAFRQLRNLDAFLAAAEYPGHHPGTGYHGVSLEEFKGGARLHFGRYHTEQIVLHTYFIDCQNLSLSRHKMQRAGEFLDLLLFPMEIYAYGHPVEYETRLGEHCAHGAGVEAEFVIEGSAVIHLALPVADSLHASPVRNYLEADFAAGHYANLQQGLGTGKFAQQFPLSLPREGDLIDYLPENQGIQLMKIVRIRHYEEACHIRAARAYADVAGPLGEEAAGPVGLTEHHDRPVFERRGPVGVARRSGASVPGRTVPAYEIEHGLVLTRWAGGAVQQPVEEFGH